MNKVEAVPRFDVFDKSREGGNLGYLIMSLDLILIKGVSSLKL